MQPKFHLTYQCGVLITAFKSLFIMVIAQCGLIHWFIPYVPVFTDAGCDNPASLHGDESKCQRCPDRAWQVETCKG